MQHLESKIWVIPELKTVLELEHPIWATCLRSALSLPGECKPTINAHLDKRGDPLKSFYVLGQVGTCLKEYYFS